MSANCSGAQWRNFSLITGEHHPAETFSRTSGASGVAQSITMARGTYEFETGNLSRANTEVDGRRNHQQRAQ
jgi:hypothetical protein